MGIILFEMTYPFATGMERVEVMKLQAVLFIYEYYYKQALTALRNSNEFPKDFEAKFPMEAELIQWLLQEDPNARPTTMELLKSDLLPPKLVL
mgnify:CR=1 FL=1